MAADDPAQPADGGAAGAQLAEPTGRDVERLNPPATDLLLERTGLEERDAVADPFRVGMTEDRPQHRLGAAEAFSPRHADQHS